MPVETPRAGLLRALTDLRQAYARCLALLDAAGQAETRIDRANAVLGATGAGGSAARWC